MSNMKCCAKNHRWCLLLLSKCNTHTSWQNKQN